ncbi:MAG: hypothetical protein RLZZ370_1770 [Bacteroidota bacterium]|jgi:TM2 domain-containing membrane protein YozV
MNKTSLKIGMMLLAAASLASCTMQKRYHSGGWNVELGLFNKDKQSAPAVKQETRVAAQQAAPVKEVEAPAAVAVEAVTPAVVATVATAPAVSATPAVEAVQGFSKASAKAQQVASAREVVAVNATAAKSVKQLKSVQIQKQAQSEAASGKSWLVALLLCFFLGGLGIHRFYLGYTWQGVVQLLTLGGLGIWVFIDFIRIIIRDLKPKDGDYTD